MAILDTTWYLSSVDNAAIAQFQTSHAYNAGEIIRQLTASVGNERVFICIVAGTSAGAEPSWTLTRGAKTTSNTATFQECTGQPALNGDLTNTPTWDAYRAFTSAATLGQIIQRNNGASLQICTTAGTMSGVGSEPTFSDTAGVTTADNAAVWTSLGPPSTYNAGWLAAAARIANLMATGFAGSDDYVYAAHTHAETRASAQTIYGVTVTGSTPINFISVDRNSGHIPPTSADLLAGASISTTGSNQLSIGNGTAYVNGFTFNSGSGAVTAPLMVGDNPSSLSNDNWWQFDNCILAAPGTSQSNNKIIFGGSGAGASSTWNCRVTLKNSQLGLGNSLDGLAFRGVDFEWTDTPDAWSINPAQYFIGGSTHVSNVRVERVDFTGVVNFNNNAADTTGVCNVSIKDCKMTDSMNMNLIASPIQGSFVITRTAQGATPYNTQKHTGGGDQYTSTTVLRHPPASDGSNSYSWHFLTNTRTSWLIPCVSLPMAAWNDVVGSMVTATVYGIWSGGVPPDNDDIWIEVEYLGTSGSTLATLVHNTKDNLLDTATQYSAESSVWDNASGWTPFAMSVDFTPQVAGWVYARVKMGGNNFGLSTGNFYVDPTLYLT